MKIRRIGYFVAAMALTLTISGCQREAGVSVTEAESVQAEEAQTAESGSDTQRSLNAQSESDPQNGSKDRHGETSQNHIEPEEPECLEVEIFGEYDSEWKDQKSILQAHADQVIVLNDGYERLNRELSAFNETTWKELHQLYKEVLPEVRSEAEEQGRDTSRYLLDRTIAMKRADSRIVSFSEEQFTNLGGAHPNGYTSGHNFDTASGEKLKLSDVAADYDGVYQYVMEWLDCQTEPEQLWENYKEMIQKMFYGDDEENVLEWYMTSEGVVIHMNRYVLTAYAAGEMEIMISFQEHPELFREEYLPGERTIPVPVTIREPFLLDTDRDGQEETFCLLDTYDERTNTSIMELTKEENGQTVKWASEYYGGFYEAYQMESENGHPYLYVEYTSDNDWRYLEIYDLVRPEPAEQEREQPGEQTAILESVGTSYAAIYDHFLQDTRKFALYDRMDFLGTYMTYRNYRVGDDGMPEPDGDIYEIVNPEGARNYTLTAKKDIPAITADESGESGGGEVVIPAGSAARPRRTDGKTFMELELDDGSRVRISVKRDEETFQFYVNGENEYDCFDGLRYVG